MIMFIVGTKLSTITSFASAISEHLISEHLISLIHLEMEACIRNKSRKYNEFILHRNFGEENDVTVTREARFIRKRARLN